MEHSYCKNCSFMDRFNCKLYAGRYIEDISVCPLTTNYYNNLSPEAEFILAHDPVIFAKWISKQRPIKLGDSVIALRSGFGCSGGGKQLTVIDFDPKCNFWTLSDNKDDKYGISADTWYEDVIKEILPEKELEEALSELNLLEDLVGSKRYSEDVYNGFRLEVCEGCRNKDLCDCSNDSIFNCSKFENYYLI